MSNPHGQDSPSAGEPADPTADPPAAPDPTPAPWQAPEQPPPPGWGQQPNPPTGEQPAWQPPTGEQPVQPAAPLAGSEEKTQNFRPDQVPGWGQQQAWPQQGWDQQQPQQQPSWDQQQQAYWNQQQPGWDQQQQQGWDQQQHRPPAWDPQSAQQTQVVNWGQQAQAWGQQQPPAWGQQHQQPGWDQQPAPPGPWDPSYGPGGQATAAKRSKMPWIIGGVALLAVAAIVGAILLLKPAFVFTKFFDANAVQTGVQKVLSTDYKIEGVGAVSCPANVQVTAGETFSCNTTVNGKPVTVQITITSSDGTYQVARPI